MARISEFHYFQDDVSDFQDGGGGGGGDDDYGLDDVFDSDPFVFNPHVTFSGPLFSDNHPRFDFDPISDAASLSDLDTVSMKQSHWSDCFRITDELRSGLEPISSEMEFMDEEEIDLNFVFDDGFDRLDFDSELVELYENHEQNLHADVDEDDGVGVSDSLEDDNVFLNSEGYPHIVDNDFDVQLYLEVLNFNEDGWIENEVFESLNDDNDGEITDISMMPPSESLPEEEANEGEEGVVAARTTLDLLLHLALEPEPEPHSDSNSITEDEEDEDEEDESALEGSPPASETVVENLPVVSLTREELENNPVTCSVCKEEILMLEKVRKLPCCHYYHSECIVPWLRIHNTCPMCRYELPTDDPDYESRKRQRFCDDHDHSSLQQD